MLTNEIYSLANISLKKKYISKEGYKKIFNDEFVKQYYNNKKQPVQLELSDLELWRQITKKVKSPSVLDLDIFTDELASHLIGDQVWINTQFNSFKTHKAAMEWFEGLCVFTTYIKADRIAKNVTVENNKLTDLIVTLNKSKPEKTPEQIREAAKIKSDLSILSIKQVGLKGNASQQPRMAHRVIEMPFDNKKWFLQYSPYQYFEKHSILVDGLERPMKVDKNSVKIMLDFVEYLPSYNIALNSDIPIVGGSILGHMHFQSGVKDYPIFNRAKKLVGENVYKIDWHITTLMVSSEDKNVVLEKGNEIIAAWRKYRDSKFKDIYNPEHNSVSLVLRKKAKKYELYILFRNNAVSEDCPWGLFHVPEEYQVIKKENIGIIEACGLAILPGRLEYKLVKESTDDAFIAWTKIVGKFKNEKEYFDRLLETFEAILNACDPLSNEDVWNRFAKKVGIND